MRQRSKKSAQPERKLQIPAVQVRQGPKRILYTFAVDGKTVHSFATISRIRRDAKAKLGGYQRPEVLSHIAEIRTYLESTDPMIPNAVVIAFDERVRFEADPIRSDDPEYLRRGTLVIPVDPEISDECKPGFIVDGQQRLAAIRDAEIGGFPIAVSAFITNDRGAQTEQFILVNSTKPLPKGLIYELLPATTGTLSSLLERRRFPAELMERLNYDKDSPLNGKIQTPTKPTGSIKDNSILRMLEHSLSDGVLYRLRLSDNDPDIVKMLRVLKAFWGAVARVFKAEWELPARRSRLVHGAGIVSLGFVMDAICDRHRERGLPTIEQFEEDLAALRPVCRWTDGYWDFGPGDQRKWSLVQNTSKDIDVLANFLLVQYKGLVWNRPRNNGASSKR